MAVLLALAVSGLAACGSGGGGSAATSAPPLSQPASTSADGLPPVNQGPLVELLLPIEEVGAGFAPTENFGSGALGPEVCEGATLDVTWTEQAAQVLSRGSGRDQAILTQTVLAFPDDEAADALVDGLIDTTGQCDPVIEFAEHDGFGERIVSIVMEGDVSDTSDGPTARPAGAGVIIREGTRVTYIFVFGAPTFKAGTVITDDLIATATDRLSS